jgi:hypothetical protein
VPFILHRCLNASVHQPQNLRHPLETWLGCPATRCGTVAPMFVEPARGGLAVDPSLRKSRTVQQRVSSGVMRRVLGREQKLVEGPREALEADKDPESSQVKSSQQGHGFRVALEVHEDSEASRVNFKALALDSDSSGRGGGRGGGRGKRSRRGRRRRARERKEEGEGEGEEEVDGDFEAQPLFSLDSPPSPSH